MTTFLLTLDCGNTRIKLQSWSCSDEALVPCAHATVPAHVDSLDLIERFARELPPGSCAALTSVADHELERRLVATLATIGPVLVSPDCGLNVATRAPERTGRDRLYAARAAWDHVRTSVIVVDAGTALTVDLVTHTSGAARATFVGGAIAPGPRLLAQAIAQGTARLPLVEAAAEEPALGRDTESALRAGIAVGFRGAARALVDALAREFALLEECADGTMPTELPVVVTGGARDFLRAAFLPRATIDDGLLVSRGLAAAARDRLRGGSS